MTDEVEIAPYRVTCHTEECPNRDVAIDVGGSLEDPYVICGPCGQLITDIQKLS